MSQCHNVTMSQCRNVTITRLSPMSKCVTMSQCHNPTSLSNVQGVTIKELPSAPVSFNNYQHDRHSIKVKRCNLGRKTVSFWKFIACNLFPWRFIFIAVNLPRSKMMMSIQTLICFIQAPPILPFCPFQIAPHHRGSSLCARIALNYFEIARRSKLTSAITSDTRDWPSKLRTLLLIPACEERQRLHF